MSKKIKKGQSLENEKRSIFLQFFSNIYITIYIFIEYCILLQFSITGLKVYYFFNIKNAKNGQISQPFYLRQTVSKLPNFFLFGLFKGQNGNSDLIFKKIFYSDKNNCSTRKCFDDKLFHL